MAIDQQAVQKEFLERIHIRTMRKDLQRLRESDVAQNSQKISSAPIFSPAPPRANVRPIDPSVVAAAKQKATEEEKQQLFAIEAEKAKLKEKIQATAKQEEPSLALQKNRLIIQEKQHEQQLRPLAQETEQLQTRLKNVEQRQNITASPTEQQRLENQRLNLEDERDIIEKRRWAAEQRLANAKKEAAKIQEQQQKTADQGQAMKSQIANLDEVAKNIYESAAARKPGTEKPTLPPISKNEQEQRRKFMEDVEKWAASNKNSNE